MSTASSRLEMLLNSLGCFSLGQGLFFFFPCTPEWLIRSYLGGNTAYFTWEILRAVCQASVIYLELFWRMLLHNSTVTVTRSPRCISKPGALLSNNIKWAISFLPIRDLLVPSCVGVWVWSWLLSVMVADLRVACPQSDSQSLEDI